MEEKRGEKFLAGRGRGVLVDRGGRALGNNTTRLRVQEGARGFSLAGIFGGTSPSCIM